jgi:hypothetical protein
MRERCLIDVHVSSGTGVQKASSMSNGPAEHLCLLHLARVQHDMNITWW